MHAQQFVLYLLKDQATQKEEKLHCNLDVGLQLMDDMQDMIEDKEEGISTLFTEGFYTPEDAKKMLLENNKEFIDFYGLRSQKIFNKLWIYYFKIISSNRITNH